MRKIMLTPIVLLFSIVLHAQQVADTLFNPPVHNPVYERGEGSIIFIDEAHANFHTLAGRFRPFANVLEKDGYVVKACSRSFTKTELSEGRILVIANSIHPDDTAWTLPAHSAFTDGEIDAVNAWVKGGGSLFLIADHMPFPGAAEKLAASFGFKLYNGFAMKKKNKGKDIFTIGAGLRENVITKGRSKEEVITSLQTFTGEAFEIPQDAVPIVVLNSDFEILLPTIAWKFDNDTQRISGENMVQGAYLKYGKGRVVMFGEAAMFTAQRQGKDTKMGMNVESASQNTQFLLNTIHWLDGIMK